MPRPRPFKEKLPRQRRTIPIPATDGAAGREKTDKGNYFRCWHCGFVCDVRRDELTDEGRHGASIGPYTPLEPFSPYGRGQVAIQLSTGVGKDAALMEQDPAGDAVTIYHKHTVVINGGCPLCGSRAWKK